MYKYNIMIDYKKKYLKYKLKYLQTKQKVKGGTSSIGHIQNSEEVVIDIGPSKEEMEENIGLSEEEMEENIGLSEEERAELEANAREAVIRWQEKEARAEAEAEEARAEAEEPKKKPDWMRKPVVLAAVLPWVVVVAVGAAVASVIRRS